jgi:DNA-binding IclR family transcriptional regulator
MDGDDQGAPRRRSIQSIEIGMRILKALATVRAASPLSALAQAVAMPAPQVHRYLQSLISAGMARQSQESGRYELGPDALQIGLVALAGTDIFRIVDRDVSAFVEHTGQTVQISALGSAGPTIVRIYNGRPALLTTLHVGSVLPLLTSATGRVFLTFVPRCETAALTAGEQAHQVRRTGEIDEICKQVKEDGKAVEQGAVIPGLNATAFPIFDLQGRAQLVAAAMTSVTDAVSRVAEVAGLGALCRRISAHAGWLAPSSDWKV